MLITQIVTVFATVVGCALAQGNGTDDTCVDSCNMAATMRTKCGLEAISDDYVNGALDHVDCVCYGITSYVTYDNCLLCGTSDEDMTAWMKAYVEVCSTISACADCDDAEERLASCDADDLDCICTSTTAKPMSEVYQECQYCRSENNLVFAQYAASCAETNVDVDPVTCAACETVIERKYECDASSTEDAYPACVCALDESTSTPMSDIMDMCIGCGNFQGDKDWLQKYATDCTAFNQETPGDESGTCGCDSYVYQKNYCASKWDTTSQDYLSCICHSIIDSNGEYVSVASDLTRCSTCAGLPDQSEWFSTMGEKCAALDGQQASQSLSTSSTSTQSTDSTVTDTTVTDSTITGPTSTEPTDPTVIDSVTGPTSTVPMDPTATDSTATGPTVTDTDSTATGPTDTPAVTASDPVMSDPAISSQSWFNDETLSATTTTTLQNAEIVSSSLENAETLSATTLTLSAIDDSTTIPDTTLGSSVKGDASVIVSLTTDASSFTLSTETHSTLETTASASASGQTLTTLSTSAIGSLKSSSTSVLTAAASALKPHVFEWLCATLFGLLAL